MPTMSTRVKEILAEMGAVLVDGHFVDTSGKHGSAYVDKDVLYTDPRRTSDVCRELSTQIFHYCRKQLRINEVTIVSPVVGGAILSQWVTYDLLNSVESGKPAGFKAYATFADRDQIVVTLSDRELVKIDGEWQEVPKGATLLLDTGAFTIKRSYGKLISGKNVVVVEGVLTTGKSAKATVDAAKKIGGNVVMVAAVCNRGGVTAEMLGVPYLCSALDVEFETFDPNIRPCPLCETGVPINVEFGYGKAFLEKTAEK